MLHGNDSLHLDGDNSAAVSAYFDSLQPDFTALYANAGYVLDALDTDLTISEDKLQPYRDAMLRHEEPFLAGMERIVQQYTDEAQRKVTRLSTIEYVVLGISLLVILLEIAYIFRPTAAHVSETVRKLVALRTQRA